MTETTQPLGQAIPGQINTQTQMHMHKPTELTPSSTSKLLQIITSLPHRTENTTPEFKMMETSFFTIIQAGLAVVLSGPRTLEELEKGLSNFVSKTTEISVSTMSLTSAPGLPTPGKRDKVLITSKCKMTETSSSMTKITQPLGQAIPGLVNLKLINNLLEKNV